MDQGFLFHAMIYMAAAVICVPIAKRLGMGSVLGYLIAGILIGPFILGFVGEEGEDILHFAEFGVVMMLFLLGLELEPTKLWNMRKSITAAGLSQLLFTSLLFFFIGLLLGFAWQFALALSLTLSMSSTAIVLQSLKEKGLLQTSAGKMSFSVLLFQDIAVIPILALLPLLALNTGDAGLNVSTGLMGQFSGIFQALIVIGAIAIIIAVGNFVILPLLRIVAKAHLRELFTVSSLLIVVGIAYLMYLIGLSPALGAFLAGVVLANSEFRHQLESDIEPFKGLLLGLFFLTVGASIDFKLIGEKPLSIALWTISIVLIKLLVLIIIGKVLKLKIRDNLIFSFSLSQVGEFAFVLIALIGQLAITDKETSSMFMAITALTMSVTPILLLINEKLILHRFEKKETNEQEADIIDEQHKVIIIGFSNFGSTIGRFLRANGVLATVLDNDLSRVDYLRKIGFKVYYGDATRLDLLESAGASEAKVIVIATGSADTNKDIFNLVKENYHQAKVLIRTKDRFGAYDFLEQGAEHVYRESLDASIRIGVDVLKNLGFRSYSATRAGQNFFRYDEESMRKLVKHRHDSKQYMSQVRQEIALQEELMANDLNFRPGDTDHAWDSDHMREIIRKL